MTDWFRSWHGAPTDPKWLGIARRAGVAPGIAVAVAWALMDRASQATERGAIDGYDAEGLACFFGCEPEQVDAIVAAMTDKGMITNGRFASWEKRQPKREDLSSERVQRFRERTKQQSERDVTQRNAPDIETEADTEREKVEASASTKKRASRLPDGWVPDEMFAAREGMAADTIRREADSFRDYWRGAPGQRGVKADWDATWRNWVRKAAQRTKPAVRQAYDYDADPANRGVL